MADEERKAGDAEWEQCMEECEEGYSACAAQCDELLDAGALASRQSASPSPCSCGTKQQSAPPSGSAYEQFRQRLVRIGALSR